MAHFTFDESSWSRLDFELLSAGGVSLYHSPSVLAEDLQWLRGQGYVIHEFLQDIWRSEDDFHARISSALGFPDYYGKNLNAFNDCITSDVQIDVDGGLVLVFHDIDSALVGRPFVQAILDMLARASGMNLLYGRRMLTLLQSGDPCIEFDPVAAVHVGWNSREWLRAKRGL
jgi:RNAse (barnase) inhibitor barstar